VNGPACPECGGPLVRQAAGAWSCARCAGDGAGVVPAPLAADGDRLVALERAILSLRGDALDRAGVVVDLERRVRALEAGGA